MPTQGSWRPLVMISVSAPALSMVRRGGRKEEVGLIAERGPTGGAPGVPAQYPARMVGQENRLAVISHPHLVGVFQPGHGGGGKAIADLHALDGVDAHQ